MEPDAALFAMVDALDEHLEIMSAETHAAFSVLHHAVAAFEAGADDLIISQANRVRFMLIGKPEAFDPREEAIARFLLAAADAAIKLAGYSPDQPEPEEVLGVVKQRWAALESVFDAHRKQAAGETQRIAPVYHFTAFGRAGLTHDEWLFVGSRQAALERTWEFADKPDAYSDYMGEEWTLFKLAIEGTVSPTITDWQASEVRDYGYLEDLDEGEGDGWTEYDIYPFANNYEDIGSTSYVVRREAIVEVLAEEALTPWERAAHKQAGMGDKVWYHAGDLDLSEPSYVHLGTRAAAEARARDVGGAPIHRVVVPSFGETLWLRGEGSDAEAQFIWYADLAHHDPSWRPPHNWAYGDEDWDWVQEQVHETGWDPQVDAVYYTNRYEDPGSISVMVRPHLIEDVSLVKQAIAQPATIYRGLAIQFNYPSKGGDPQENAKAVAYVKGEGVSDREWAQLLLDRALTGTSWSDQMVRGQGVGVHWTTRLSTAQSFGRELSGGVDHRDTGEESVYAGIVLEGQIPLSTPDPIETDPDLLYGLTSPYGIPKTNPEGEVPLKPGASVQLNAVWVPKPTVDIDTKRNQYGTWTLYATRGEQEWVRIPVSRQVVASSDLRFEVLDGGPTGQVRAWDGERRVAFLSWDTDDGNPGPLPAGHCVVTAVRVEPSHRGTGLSKQLLERAHQAAGRPFVIRTFFTPHGEQWAQRMAAELNYVTYVPSPPGWEYEDPETSIWNLSKQASVYPSALDEYLRFVQNYDVETAIQYAAETVAGDFTTPERFSEERAEEFLLGVLEDNGIERDRVTISFDPSAPGEGHLGWHRQSGGFHHINIASRTDFTILHEAAHAIDRSSRANAHGQEFFATYRQLLDRYSRNGKEFWVEMGTQAAGLWNLHRRALEEDKLLHRMTLQQAQDFARRTYSKTASRIRYEVVPQSTVDHSDYAVLVYAWDGERKVGRLEANYHWGHEGEYEPTWHVWHIYVEEDYRRQNIGRGMVKALRDEFPDHLIIWSGFVSIEGEDFARSLDPEFNRVVGKTAFAERLNWRVVDPRPEHQTVEAVYLGIRFRLQGRDRDPDGSGWWTLSILEPADDVQLAVPHHHRFDDDYWNQEVQTHFDTLDEAKRYVEERIIGTGMVDQMLPRDLFPQGSTRYHLTLSRHVSSILSRGLEPRSQVGTGTSVFSELKKVTSILWDLKNEDWAAYEGEDIALLELDVSGLPRSTVKALGGEERVNDTIEPSRIRVLVDDIPWYLTESRFSSWSLSESEALALLRRDPAVTRRAWTGSEEDLEALTSQAKTATLEDLHVPLDQLRGMVSGLVAAYEANEPVEYQEAVERFYRWRGGNDYIEPEGIATMNALRTVADNATTERGEPLPGHPGYEVVGTPNHVTATVAFDDLDVAYKALLWNPTQPVERSEARYRGKRIPVSRVDFEVKGDALDVYLARTAGPFQRQGLATSLIEYAQEREEADRVIFTSPVVGPGGFPLKRRFATFQHPVGVMEDVAHKGGTEGQQFSTLKAVAEFLRETLWSAGQTREVMVADKPTSISVPEGKSGLIVVTQAPEFFSPGGMGADARAFVSEVPQSPPVDYVLYLPRLPVSEMVLLHEAAHIINGLQGGQFGHEQDWAKLYISLLDGSWDPDLQGLANLVRYATGLGTTAAAGVDIEVRREGSKSLDVVARKGEQVVGALNVSYSSWYEHWQVHRVFVDPSHRRQGIATAMYQRAVEEVGEPIVHSKELSPSGAEWADAVSPDQAADQTFERHLPTWGTDPSWPGFLERHASLDLDAIEEVTRECRGDTGQLGVCGHTAPRIEREFGYPMEQGFYRGPDGRRMVLHAWNVLPDGSVLDATADQFGHETVRVVDEVQAAVEYEAFTDEHEAFRDWYREQNYGREPDVQDWTLLFSAWRRGEVEASLTDGVMYHVSAGHNRESIAQHGLRLAEGFWDFETRSRTGRYIWLFADRETAERWLGGSWGGSRGFNDLWEVDVSGYDVQPDPHPGWQDTDTYVVTEPIPPERVRLVKTVTKQGARDVWYHSGGDPRRYEVTGGNFGWPHLGSYEAASTRGNMWLERGMYEVRIAPRNPVNSESNLANDFDANRIDQWLRLGAPRDEDGQPTIPGEHISNSKDLANLRHAVQTIGFDENRHDAIYYRNDVEHSGSASVMVDPRAIVSAEPVHGGQTRLFAKEASRTTTIYRGINVWWSRAGWDLLERYKQAGDPEAKAEVILEAIEGYEGGVGVHWTTDIDVAQNFARMSGSGLRVVLEAEVSPDDFEEDAEHYDMKPQYGEEEFPVKRGASIHLTKLYFLEFERGRGSRWYPVPVGKRVTAVRGDGDGFVYTEDGDRYWGVHGAAGLLVRHIDDEGTTWFFLQKRSGAVEEGGTWSIPGGAIDSHETPTQAALREFAEETGLPTHGLGVIATYVSQPVPEWSYTTVVAETPDALDTPDLVGWEQEDSGWFTLDEMRSMRLHPGLRDSLDDVARFAAAEVMYRGLRVAVPTEDYVAFLEGPSSQASGDRFIRPHLRDDDSRAWWSPFETIAQDYAGGVVVEGDMTRVGIVLRAEAHAEDIEFIESAPMHPEGMYETTGPVRVFGYRVAVPREVPDSIEGLRLGPAPEQVSWAGEFWWGRTAADYQTGHRPTKGFPAHTFPKGDYDWDGTGPVPEGGGLLPDDVWQHPEWYTGFPQWTGRVMRTLREVQGNPSAAVRVYRAVPKDVNKLQPGDWVTLSPEYAAQHALYDDDYVVKSTTSKGVEARHVHFAGDDLMEWGYFGPERGLLTVPKYSALEAAANTEVYYEVTWDGDDMRVTAHAEDKPGPSIMEDDIVGELLVRRHEDGQWRVKGTWVDRSHRRRGIATGMIAVARDEVAPEPISLTQEFSEVGEAWGRTVDLHLGSLSELDQTPMPA